MRNLNNAIEKVRTHKGPLTKSLVCYTAKCTLNQASRGWIPVPAELQGNLRSVLERPLLGRKLDKALNAEGLAWLMTFFFTKSGSPRFTKDVRGLPQLVFDTIKTFSHFTFDGFQHDGHGTYTPCWRVHSRKGWSFAYCYTGGRFSYGGGLEVYGLNYGKSKAA